MTFTITYRSQSGALQREVVEAANRTAALEQAKSRGITPVSVKEGGTLATAAKVAAAQPTWIKGAVAGLVVVVAAVIAFFCLMPTEKPAAPKVEKPKKVRKVVAPIESRSQSSDKTGIVISEKKVATPVVADQMPEKPRVGQVYTNGEGLVKRHLVDIDPAYLRPRTNRVFKTSIEQAISWVFTTRLGDPPMPLPALSKKDREDIWSILKSQCEVSEGDSEKVAEMKASVNAVKKEMLQYIKDGGTPEDFLEYYHGQLRTAARQRQESTRAALKVRKEDPEMYEEFVRTVNEQLRANGIREMSLPPLDGKCSRPMKDR